MLLPHTLYVITGANRGFGKAIAHAIASKVNHTATMVLVGRQSDSLERVARNIVEKNPKISTRLISNVSLDSAMTAQDTILKPLETIVTHHVPAVTRAILVNNAGSTGDLSKKVADYEPQEIQSYMDMNIVSYITLISGFIRLFYPKAEEEEDTIRPIAPQLTLVNISSLLAVEPFANWGLYATGKSARDMLLRILAKEEDKESVRTLSYAPGPLDNEMQKHVRETLGDTKQKKLYTDMANENKLVSMEASADKLVELLHNNAFESGAHIDFFDP
ncbi:sepiapterin reductase [Phascolomyces articulosus]|uniref:Sepiapterin reductase n=1 Tax=Phascolomyces articulosus TaxID=60185 RepID=A0AAD5K5I4_9FUNG|nr:sepiapterin reductase [Phascolomyces articulosus]